MGGGRGRFSNGCTIGCPSCDNATIETGGVSLCSNPSVR